MPDAASSTDAPRLLRLSVLAAVLAAVSLTPPLLPPGCGIGWTMVGGVLIYEPDCTHRSPAPPPPPDGPPPNPAPAPPP